MKLQSDGQTVSRSSYKKTKTDRNWKLEASWKTRSTEWLYVSYDSYTSTYELTVQLYYKMLNICDIDQ